MSTPQQEPKPTRRWQGALSGMQPRQMIFLGVALVVIALQLLAMDWVVLGDVDQAQTNASQRLALKSEGAQVAQTTTVATRVSSYEAQSPQGDSTLSYSSER